MIVFIASIVVPLFKLLTLTWLLISVQKRSTRHPLNGRVSTADRAGWPWSMLDIYVVTMLAALVQMQSWQRQGRTRGNRLWRRCRTDHVRRHAL